MLKNRLYYLFAVWLLFLSSCNDNPINSKIIADINPVQKSPNIQKLEKKGINKVYFKKESNSIYQNSTSNYQCIGELIEDNIGFLATKRNNIKISQDPSSLIKDYFVPQANQKKTAWLVRLMLDNDIFNNTDYYYTNGFKLSLVIPGLKKSPINKIFPATRQIDIELSGFSITQNIYTPTNPDTRDVLFGDRPFASYLAIGQFREVYNLSKSIYLKSELKLGVMGPSSFGQQVQSSIHDIEPVGWQNQISNDFVIDYQLQLKKGIYNNSLIDINLTTSGNIGTLFNKASGGIDLRIGSFTPFYSGPLSVFENVNQGGHLQYWIFFKAKGNFVVYDATLQGGIFNEGDSYTIPAGNINQFVFDASLGFALYYNNIGVEYQHYYLSPEFKGARHFGWGSIKLSLAF